MASRAPEPEPDARLVEVWHTTERLLLPHVLSALEQAGIEYTVQDRSLADQIMGYRATESVGETRPPFAVLVRAEHEAAAREVVSTALSPDIGSAPLAPPPSEVPPTQPSVQRAGPPVELIDKTTGAIIGRVTEMQFRSVADHLERESVRDDDYYIDEATLSVLEGTKADPETIALLRAALGARSGMDVQWRKV